MFLFYLQMDIMLLADKHIKVRGSNGQRYSLSEACRDVVAFQRLNDGVSFKVFHLAQQKFCTNSVADF